MDDVASKVQLAVASSTYDDKTHTVTMRVALLNKSADTIRAPLEVLVTALSSQFGTPRIVGADNDRDGVGAVWDFSALVPTTGLAPNAETRARTLTFRLDGAVGYDRFEWAKTQSAVRFDARVFASKKESVTSAGARRP